MTTSLLLIVAAVVVAVALVVRWVYHRITEPPRGGIGSGRG